jgi:membrane protein DedA with SNARE-associated domain
VHYGVPLVALMICAGEVGVPTGVPAEIALLLAGAYAVDSLPALIVGVLLVALGDFIGTTAMHLVARTGGVRLMTRLLRRHDAQREETVARWRRRLGGHDVAVVFVLRLLPLLRMWVAIGTGLLRIRLRSYLLGAAPAAVAWAGTLLVLGYVFRADVHALEARYTSAAHVLLAMLPAFSLITGVAWWVGSGHSLRASMHRGRSVLGLLAALFSAGVLVRMAWANEWAVEHGAAALPRPLLVLWIAGLAGLAATLLVYAYADLRASRRAHPRSGRPSRDTRLEIASVLVWVALLCTAGVIPMVLERLDPAL